MAYVAVKGGEKAIKEALKLGEYFRCNGDKLPIEVEQIKDQMSLAVDRVMSEGSLYDKDLAALALKQCQGDVLEASFYIRAFRSTLPRNLYSIPMELSEMDVLRRISAAFKDIPGGQYLGASKDYEKKVLNFSLMNEEKEHMKNFIEEYLKEELTPVNNIPQFPKVSDLLREEGLLEDCKGEEEGIDDITRNSLKFPVSRSARLQSLTRGETGAVIALAYSVVRGYGDIHPYVGELRIGNVELEVPHPIYEGETITIGKVMVTEAEVISKMSQESNQEEMPKLTLGYGLCMGNNESKAIAMAILDRSLNTEEGNSPGEDEEFVLYHIDGIESTGFISHFKLPHYVDFQADLSILRDIQERKGKSDEHI